MPDWLKAIIAGYGAKKLGGGCFSTILIFVLIYWGLGKCNPSQTAAPRQGVIKTEQPKKVAVVKPAGSFHLAQSK